MPFVSNVRRSGSVGSRFTPLALVATSLLGCAAAYGQATFPILFAAHNGNLEGSVSSFRIQEDGSLSFIQELVLGARASGEPANPGTNAYCISVSPKGKFLAISHATSFSTEERISIVQVAADGTLTSFANLSTYDSPLSLAWVNDTQLAVTRTRTSGNNNVLLYAFSEEARTITLSNFRNIPGFCSSLAVSAGGRYIACNDSPIGGGGAVHMFEVVGTMLEPRAYLGTNTGYAIGLGFSPDARHLYACGGSLQPYAVAGFDLQPDGSLFYMPNSPFSSPGASPKQAVASADGSKLYVGHGSDSTIVAMNIDSTTGELSTLQIAYDVGMQGSLGDIAAMEVFGRQMLFFTDKQTFDDTPTGVFSAEINPDGSLRIISERVPTQGIEPGDIAVWKPVVSACPADLDDGSGAGTSDGAVTIDDLLYFLPLFEAGDVAVDLDNGTGTGTPDDAVTVDDLLFFLVRFEAGC